MISINSAGTQLHPAACPGHAADTGSQTGNHITTGTIQRARLVLLAALLCFSGSAAAVDTDGDGVDDAIDNCTLVANADQRDTDNDGYGNQCDGDLNNDPNHLVNIPDLGLFKSVFGQAAPLVPPYTLNSHADFNGDGVVNIPDLGIFKSMFGQSAGPSCIQQPGGCVAAAEPVARPDTYATPMGKTLDVAASRITGLLHNDSDPQGQALTALLVSPPASGALVLNPDGSFTYTPGAGLTENQNDSFTYQAQDTDLNLSQVTTVNIHIESDQRDFKIMMNYELGMHCTGFEFAYCCVLPVYNSILAQVVKPNATGQGFPEMLEGDPNENLDALGRETVVRDRSRTGNTFRKYVVTYTHDAQPRLEGNGKAQSSTLISAVEGNSLMSWNTTFDSAMVVGGALQYGAYNGADGVLQGNGNFNDPSDNYQNAVWNHLYIYADLEGTLNGSLEANKIRLGVSGQPILDVVYPEDCGAALQPMGPVTQNGDPANPVVDNTCGGFSKGNLLTFSGDTGTVVYTQMKVLENLPVTLTSPRIWEALGLPLTPFEDSIDFFGDPGLVDEDSVRPFVAMKAQLHAYDPGVANGVGAATLNGDGTPVIGFGTAPIDIPNCERCHSNPADGTLVANSAAEGGGFQTVVNSPNNNPAQYALVAQEYSFWAAFYSIDTSAGDSDWYARLKSAAISMLSAHDAQHGTSFAANYPGVSVPGTPPQNTRLGHESVICQRCHADNVIAVVKSASAGGALVPPITEAVHNNHRGVSTGGPIAFSDSQGRDGGCQGCHPAHRSSGEMHGYPITLAGANLYAGGDNRGASGGCFVGRDVHSNPGKDTDGAETPEHLNAVGQYLSANVFSDQDADGNDMGIWCTNCHNQFGQEMWKAENVVSLVHAQPGDPGHVRQPSAGATLGDVVSAVNTALGTSYTEAQAIAWIDPTDTNPLGDFTHAIWDELPTPELCAFLVDPTNPANDANVATIEVALPSAGHTCSTGAQVGPVDCSSVGGPAFNICGSFDGDGDFSVNILDFCTTPDCVTAAQGTLANSAAVPVPFSAATDGRDHWLSAGEPHCADCHEAPFTEQSGNVNAFAPFNYPRKASLMRYSRGHQDITCQGCHESIHGLYPVTPSIDNTSYAQAAALNADGSHGPLKCASCHAVNAQGIPTFMATNRAVYSVPGYGGAGINSFDEAVAWAHTYTDERNVLETTCQNCHGVQGTNWSSVSFNNGTYMRHAMRNPPRGSRQMMDKAETQLFGAPISNAGNNATQDNGVGGMCGTCHGDRSGQVACTNNTWLNHLTQGRVTAAAFEKVSLFRTGTTCGW